MGMHAASAISSRRQQLQPDDDEPPAISPPLTSSPTDRRQTAGRGSFLLEAVAALTSLTGACYQHPHSRLTLAFTFYYCCAIR